MSMFKEVSTTALRACFGMPHKDLKKKVLLGFVISQLALNQNEMYAADCENTAWYYSGMVDAYDIVAAAMTNVIDHETYEELMQFRTGREAVIESLKEIAA